MFWHVLSRAALHNQRVFPRAVMRIQSVFSFVVFSAAQVACIGAVPWVINYNILLQARPGGLSRLAVTPSFCPHPLSSLPNSIYTTFSLRVLHCDTRVVSVVRVR